MNNLDKDIGFLILMLFCFVLTACSVKMAYQISPAGQNDQAQYEICEKSIIDTLSDPDSYSHNRRFNTSVVSRVYQGDKWHVSVVYAAKDDDGVEKTYKALCYNEDGKSEIVYNKFVSLS